MSQQIQARAKKVIIWRLFHGIASVRDYLVKSAQEKHQDLLIILKDTGEEMLIPWVELNKGRKDTYQHRSKHGTKPYFLIDYNFKNTNKQRKLL